MKNQNRNRPGWMDKSVASIVGPKLSPEPFGQMKQKLQNKLAKSGGVVLKRWDTKLNGHSRGYHRVQIQTPDGKIRNYYWDYLSGSWRNS
jgi:hypothetical protein